MCDLFQLLSPFEQRLHVPEGDRSLEVTPTLFEHLYSEPQRVQWMLNWRPDQILWGQAPNMARIHAWSRLCTELGAEMDARTEAIVTAPHKRTDVFDQWVRDQLPWKPPLFEDMIEGTGMINLAEGWLHHMVRYQLVLESIAAQPSAGFDQEKARTLLGAISHNRITFMQHIHWLRKFVCMEMRTEMKHFTASVTMARSICCAASHAFAVAEDKRTKPGPQPPIDHEVNPF